MGLPGDGKTQNYVKPNLMQMNGSYIVTDPKGLLVHEFGSLLAKNGYKIKVKFNPRIDYLKIVDEIYFKGEVL